jgi:hypothetical protein
METKTPNSPLNVPVIGNPLTAQDVAGPVPVAIKTNVRPTELQLPPGCDRWGTDLQKMEQTGADMAEAARRTPDVVRTALAPDALSVGGLVLHKFTLQTYINLETMDSPFIQRGGEKVIKVRDITLALWAMTVPDEEVEKRLWIGGEQLRRVQVEFAKTLSIADLGAMASVISEEIARGFGPAAKLNPPKQEGGATPLEIPSSATAPAGS